MIHTVLNVALDSLNVLLRAAVHGIVLIHLNILLYWNTNIIINKARLNSKK